MCVSSYYYMCPHTTIYVPSYYYMCVCPQTTVLILLYMCPHTTICVLILIYILSPGVELRKSKSADLYEKAVGYAEGYAAGLDQASLRPHTLVA